MAAPTNRARKKEEATLPSTKYNHELREDKIIGVFGSLLQSCFILTQQVIYSVRFVKR